MTTTSDFEPPPPRGQPEHHMGQALKRRRGPIIRTGRPRKLNVVRDSSGKSRGEIVDFSVVLNQPHRREAKDPKSELLGYPLGRLRLSGQISEGQHRAGNEWALLVRLYAGMIGLPQGSPQSGSALGSTGAPSYAFAQDVARADAEEYARRLQAVRCRYDDCFTRLGRLGRELDRGHLILIAMRRVCIEERYPGEVELGDLRLGLNAMMAELGVR